MVGNVDANWDSEVRPGVRAQLARTLQIVPIFYLIETLQLVVEVDAQSASWDVAKMSWRPDEFDVMLFPSSHFQALVSDKIEYAVHQPAQTRCCKSRVMTMYHILMGSYSLFHRISKASTYQRTPSFRMTFRAQNGSYGGERQCPKVTAISSLITVILDLKEIESDKATARQ